MGTIHVWIGKDSIARDLLVKRGKIYGDRNELPAALGIKSGSEILPLMGIGDNVSAMMVYTSCNFANKSLLYKFWRHRNFIHSIMRDSSLQMFYDYPIQENKLTLRRMLDAPEKWSENIITHASRTVARIAWGDPKHAKKLLTVVPKLLKAISPGAGPLPNVLPFLQYLPAAISPYKKAEASRKHEMEEAFFEAQEEATKAFEDGTAEDSWTKIWLEKSAEKSNLTKHEAAHAIGSNSLVAIATIGSPMHSFCIAMCHYPSWLLRLQEEVDRVCGDTRLPTLNDLPEMPVLRAVVKETIRWRQAVPGGVPHQTTQDDVYDGYFIPKGAIVHANHFAISRDEDLYPDAVEFRPERWIEPGWPTYKEPLAEHPALRGDIAFGYGIRSCPGTDLVIQELYPLIGAIVWAFDIKRPEGLRGYMNPIPWYEMNPYVITMAKNFPINLKIRSEEKARFIRAGCPEGPAWLVKERRDSIITSPVDRWDVHTTKGKKYDWEGLTAELTGFKAPRSYSPGV